MRFHPIPFLLLFSFIACVPTSSKRTTVPSTDDAGEISGTGPDPLASYAWHLENTGQSSFSLTSGISGEDIKVNDVFNMNITGSGIRIAVSDTGTDTNHPDLSGNEYSAGHRSYASDSPSTWRNSNPYPIEYEGHGTAVAGLISALGWNGIGSRGVAPESNFSGFLFIGNFHNSESSYEAKTIDQMTGDFDIFNYSYGYVGCSFYPATDSVINSYYSGVTNLRNGKGAIYVKAAGNDYVGYNSDCINNDTSYYLGNTNTSEDQNVPYIIIAAAVNAKGQISSYSTPGSGIWVSSAGGEFGDDDPAMITTDIVGCTHGLSTSSSDESIFNQGKSSLNTNCNYTNIMNGTSSATPTLAGVIALMLSANPELSWRDAKYILAKTATPINYSTSAISHPSGTLNSLSNHVYDYRYIRNAANISYSNTYGFGRVDAYAAVEMAKAYVSILGDYSETKNPNTGNWYYDSGSINLSIPDNSYVGVTSAISSLHNNNIESVQVNVSITHTYIGDLGVELTSPNGTTSKLLLINSNIKDENLNNYTLLTNAFFGESSKGIWQLKIIDGAAIDTGYLKNWKLKINGSNTIEKSDYAEPLAPASLNINSNTATFNSSVSSDVLRYEVSAGTTSGGNQSLEWYSIGSATSFSLSNLGLRSGQTYYINVRAVDTSENISTSISKTWLAN